MMTSSNLPEWKVQRRLDSTGIYFVVRRSDDRLLGSVVRHEDRWNARAAVYAWGKFSHLRPVGPPEGFTTRREAAAEAWIQRDLF